MVLLVGLARDPRVMGDAPISKGLAIAGWSVAVILIALGVLLVIAQTTGVA
jgi:Mn2+/Fe2+ NRAMP family transporter